MEPVRINLSLDIPAQRLLSAYIDYNEEMEQQAKMGIENAINHLCKDNNLSKLVEEQVYTTLKSSFSSWNVQQIIKECFDAKLKDYLYNKSKEIAEKMVNNIDI